MSQKQKGLNFVIEHTLDTDDDSIEDYIDDIMIPKKDNKSYKMAKTLNKIFHQKTRENIWVFLYELQLI